MIRGSEDTRYTFPIGVIKVWETRLLTKIHYDRLLTLPDETRILPSLHDTTYGQFRDMPFERVLESVQTGAYDFLVRYCIDPEIIDLIQLPKRIHNLKVEFKGKLLERDYQDLLYDVKSAAIDGIEEVVTQFLETKDPFLLDVGLDRIEILTAINLAARFPFLVNYYRLKADLYNISSLIRLARLGLGRKTGLSLFVHTDGFKPEYLASLLDQGFDGIRSSFSRSPYQNLIAQGLDFLEKKNSFLRFERLIDESLLSYMKQARRFIFGVEPLFCYYSFLEAEITRLRRIYIGKLHRLPVDEIRESLPEVY
ncbi:MAG TPA: hypothetical protein EYP58_02605 [bacterium (Candidatus Stahlbacteria)]|nr:hypothetical protein [Candidatus Stahlbacteria bacterium]